MTKTALSLPLLAGASTLRAQEPQRIVDCGLTVRIDMPDRQVAAEGPLGVDFRNADPIALVLRGRTRIDTLPDPAEKRLAGDNRRRIERRPNA